MAASVPLTPSVHSESDPSDLYRDYFAAVLRTHQSFVAPAQGKLLNYVERVPLGVVAQITVSFIKLRYYSS